MKTGRIYKITHNQSDICYVGSTFNTVRQRFMTHKKSGKYNKRKPIIVKYLNQYGKKNFTCVLIKEYQVVDRRHLFAYEQLWINKLNCINKYNTMLFFKKQKVKIRKDKYRKTEKGKKKIKAYRQLTMVCSCGKTIRKTYKSVHIKSAYHIVNTK